MAEYGLVSVHASTIGTIPRRSCDDLWIWSAEHERALNFYDGSGTAASDSQTRRHRSWVRRSTSPVCLRIGSRVERAIFWSRTAACAPLQRVLLRTVSCQRAPSRRSRDLCPLVCPAGAPDAQRGTAEGGTSRDPAGPATLANHSTWHGDRAEWVPSVGPGHIIQAQGPGGAVVPSLG